MTDPVIPPSPDDVNVPACPTCHTLEMERYDPATLSGKCVRKHHLSWSSIRQAWYSQDTSS